MLFLKKLFSGLHLRNNERDRDPYGRRVPPKEKEQCTKLQKHKRFPDSEDFNFEWGAPNQDTLSDFLRPVGTRRPDRFVGSHFSLWQDEINSSNPGAADPFPEAGRAPRTSAGEAAFSGTASNLDHTLIVNRSNEETNPYRKGKGCARSPGWNLHQRFANKEPLVQTWIELQHEQEQEEQQQRQQQTDDILELQEIFMMEIAKAQDEDDKRMARQLTPEEQNDERMARELQDQLEREQMDEMMARELQEQMGRERTDETIAQELQAQIEQEQEQREREQMDERLAREVQEQIQKEQEEIDRIAAEKARFRECVVCGDTKETLEFPARAPTPACDHGSNTCKECLESWMASEFDKKGCDGIKCPECPMTLEHNDVQRAASAKTFKAYDKISARNALSSMPGFSWCLATGCSSGQINEEDEDNFMECDSCGYKQCLKHNTPWHKDETCEQYDYRTSGQKSRDEEAKTDAMIDSVSKKCPGPNCGSRIQKTHGCDHMTCRNCRYEFCWQCLASHQRIRQVGNSAHQRSCKFHSDNLRAPLYPA